MFIVTNKKDKYSTICAATKLLYEMLGNWCDIGLLNGDYIEGLETVN